MRDRLLVVDGDPTSLRVMDVSLRSAGFDVATATTGTEAWALLEDGLPDLIIADTNLLGIDGFELCLRLRKNPLGNGIPFIFLAADKTLEHKIRSLAAGANDYLVKPAYIKEVVARVRALLQRRDRELLASDQNATNGRDRFAGDLADITVVDLVQLIEGNARSGIAHLRASNGAPASIYFRHGQVVDSEVGKLSGADALSRLFSWTAGSFEIEWRSIRRKDVIERSSSDLVVQGMKRLDEWNRLLGTLPDPHAVFEVDYRFLAERLAEIPDEVNEILRLCDGVRTIVQVVEDCSVPDVEALTAVTRLRDEGIVYDVSAVRAPQRESGSSRLEDWLGAGSAPFRTGPSAPGGTGRTGIGSGPVEQSFADRLQVEAEAEAAIPPPIPPAAHDSSSESRPPRHRTAPGLGHPVTANEAELSTPGGGFSHSGDGIPEPRVEQAIEQATDQDAHTNVIKFPRDGAPTAPEAAQMIPAPPDSGAAKLVPVSLVPISPEGESRSAPFETAEARPTLPLAREGEMPEQHVQSMEATRPADVPAALPERGNPEITGPASLTDTYRGFGPKPGSVVPRRGEAPTHTQAPQPSLTPGRDSGRVMASGTLTTIATPSDEPPVSFQPSAPTALTSEEGTVRVSFPDDDITRGDALDELGLPSRWRGMRMLGVAALAGVLAAIGVYGFKSRTRIPRAGGSDHAVAVPSAVAPANKVPEVGAQAIRPVPTAAHPPGDVAPVVGPNAAGQPPAVDLPSPPRSAAASPPASPSDHGPGQQAKAAQRDPSAAPVVAAPVVAAPAVVAPSVAAPSPAPAGRSAKVAPAAEPPEPSVPAIDFSRRLSDCRTAFARNKLRDALSACTAAVEANPNSAEALTMLAHTELNRGRLGRAGELAAKAITLDPNLADAYVIIGGARQDSGQNREAKAAYRRYLQLAPRGRYADELRSIVNTL